MKSLLSLPSQISFLILCFFILTVNSYAQKDENQIIQRKSADLLLEHFKPRDVESSPTGLKRGDELIDKRTEHSRTIFEKENQFTEVASLRPMHYKKDGKWEPINTEIKSDGINGYPYSNVTNSFKTYFPSNVTSGMRSDFGDGNVIRDMLNAELLFMDSDGQIIHSSSISSSSSNMELLSASNQGRYSNVYPNVDFQVTVGRALRKADYLIKNNSFLSLIPENAVYVVFKEDFQLPEVVTARLNNRQIEFFDSKGNANGGFYPQR